MKSLVRTLPVVLAALLVGAAAWSVWRHDALTHWMRESGPVPFFAAMALLPALGVPLSPLFLLAGATFGRGVGLLGAWVALGVNLALCYGLAQRVRRFIGPALRPYQDTVSDTALCQRHPLRFVLTVKLTPGVPAFVKNYGLGLAGIPFPLYFWVSLLWTGLYGTVLVLLGESLFEHQLSPTLLMGGGALLALWTLSTLWRRRQRKKSTSPQKMELPPGQLPHAP